MDQKDAAAPTAENNTSKSKAHGDGGVGGGVPCDVGTDTA